MIATEVETARLALLPLRVEYAEEMAGVLGAPELYEFTGGEPPTVADLTARYGRQVAGPDRPGEYWLNWVLRSLQDDALVGYVQATVTSDEAEIAWVVGTAWQGHGYAKEAAAGLVSWLEAHGVRRIVAHVHPEHGASAAVSAAAGLSRTEVVQDGEYRWERDLL
ncbi:GNAT family N-acetyltransferase [Kribbella qitaiheensis]|uniref:GNAT family N-acetyltransferase n=1 Tax=Kribbella qitaiheensis TaxID=1544730 RepID=A0A7G6X5E0_9ACTN|nr:GNAT family N-acetyltransferase [Kribbella qitaiheensis]QNE21455.1 GNAT family N-acetyltransferase [Kribbella qitaiheensis]